MRLRTFTAHDMPSAMQQVREALGEDAVILSSQKSKKGVSITAAVEQNEESKLEKFTPAHPPQATEPLRFHIHEILRFHNLPELFIAKILQKSTDDELSSLQAEHHASGRSDERHLLRLALEKLTASYFNYHPITLKKGNILMLIGPPGIGKTLTIARIAAKLTMDKQPLLVITTDNKRAGGIEQLQAFTNILGHPLKVAPTYSALAQHIKSAKKQAHVLIDTTGCNPYDAAELDELTTFASLEGVEPVLTLSAGGDSLEAIDMVEAFMALPIKRLLVTRADTARRFGGVLAAAAAHNLAFCNASSSSSITDPLLPMDETLLAQLLLKYKY